MEHPVQKKANESQRTATNKNMLKFVEFNNFLNGSLLITKSKGGTNERRRKANRGCGQGCLQHNIKKGPVTK